MPKTNLRRRDFISGVVGATANSAASILNPAKALAGGAASPAAPEQAPAAGEPWFLKPDAEWVGKLSQPKYDIEFEFNVKKVPMRDGVMLSANIWRPKAEGRFPVIYIHIAYDKSNATFAIRRAQFFVPRGYVFVAVDCRGRYDSDGEAYFYWHTDWKKGGFEGEDVDDSLTWIGKQEWSNGKTGMTGPSYLGFVQWMGAPLGNPYLTTLIPYVTPDDHYDNVFPGGAFQLTNSMHCVAIIGGSRTNNFDLESFWFDWNKLTLHMPLRTLDRAMLGKTAQVWQDFMDHPDNDDYWRFSVGDRPASGVMTAGRYPQVKVPTLNITGWYDQVSQATINNYLGMVQYGPEALRNKHHLIVGPWEHAVGMRKIGDLDFGPIATAEALPPDLHWHAYWLKPIELRWYDHWLKGIDNGIMDEAPVHVFQMGTNVWKSEPAWPLSRAKNTEFYLRSSGHANSRYGDGTLSAQAPAAERTDRFVFDPADPVPTYGCIQPWQGYGIPNSDGPRDQRLVQGRNDILVFTGEALETDLGITGRILCKLYAATTAKDTDFAAKLVDVHPDGYAQILREGIIRARYRQSFKKQELLTPGQVYEYTIDLWSVSHVFLKGHKVQVEISSSNFPKYDRNPNSGLRFGDDTEFHKATQTIYHNSQYPSCIILPVVAT